MHIIDELKLPEFWPDDDPEPDPVRRENITPKTILSVITVKMMNPMITQKINNPVLPAQYDLSDVLRKLKKFEKFSSNQLICLTENETDHF